MAEVDAVEVVPLVVGLLVERLARAAEMTDVVDEHVDPAELVAGGRDERLGDAGLAYVDDRRDRATAVAGDRDLRVSRRGRRSISAITTAAPSRANRSEIPRPMPPPPPVTIATLPSSSPSIPADANRPEASVTRTT